MPHIQYHSLPLFKLHAPHAYGSSRLNMAAHRVAHGRSWALANIYNEAAGNSRSYLPTRCRQMLLPSLYTYMFLYLAELHQIAADVLNTSRILPEQNIQQSNPRVPCASPNQNTMQLSVSDNATCILTVTALLLLSQLETTIGTQTFSYKDQSRCSSIQLDTFSTHNA